MPDQVKAQRMSTAQLTAYHAIQTLQQMDSQGGLPDVAHEQKEYEFVNGAATAVAAVQKKVNELAAQGFEVEFALSSGTNITIIMSRIHVVLASPPAEEEEVPAQPAEGTPADAQG